MLVFSKINLEERRGVEGGGGRGRRTGLFLAIESFYFCQDGRKTLTFLLFVLISFVQGVASDLRKWAGSILAGIV